MALLVVFAPVAPAAAANFSCNWSTGTSSNWNMAGNWSSCNAAFPNNGADTFTATIDAAGTYTVLLLAGMLVFAAMHIQKRIRAR